MLVVGAHAQSHFSMQRYTGLLAQTLEQAGFEVTVIRPSAIFYGRLGRSKWLAYIDKFVIFPLRLRRTAKRYSYVHIADHSDAIFGFFLPGPWTVTCHDLHAVRAARGGVEGVRIRWTGRIYQRLVAKAMKRSAAILAVSNSTADQVRQALDRTATVARLPLEPVFRESPADFATQGEFALIVASPSWRKNRCQAIACWLHLRETARLRVLPLVVVGGVLTEEERALVTAHGAHGAIHVVGSVSDEKLADLYRRCAFLIVMSRAEGFGWPIIEAGAAARGVLCADLPVLRETAGDGGVYVGSEMDWEKIASDLISPDLRGRALENSRRYDEERFAETLRRFVRESV